MKILFLILLSFFAVSTSAQIHLFKDNLLKKFPCQTTEFTCVPTCLAYADRAFGGSMYESDYVKLFNQQFQNEVPCDQGGISLGSTYQFAANNFIVARCTNYKAAINAGHPILTQIHVDDYTHAILIVGYSQDDKITYFDPAYGRLFSMPVEKWTSTRNIGIPLEIFNISLSSSAKN